MQRERIILKAREATDLGSYAVFAARPSEESVASGDVPYVFWFPDRELKAGDLVVLYTKSGSPSEKKNEGGATTYFYYWGLDKPIWADSAYRAVLVNTPLWEISNR